MIIRDTTHRDMIATRLNNQKFIDNLLSSLSHEFNTCLNGVLNFLEAALIDPRISPAHKEDALLPAKKSAEILSYLLRDAIDFASLLTKELQFEYQNIKLNTILTKCIELIEVQARKKDIKIDLDISPLCPRKIRTDKSRFIQIMLNLLSNALKFTFHGRISIRAERFGDIVKISVTDTGIGMTSDEVHKLRLALKDVTSGEKISKNSSGIGMGLKVAHIFASALGPKDKTGIAFETMENKGSSFYFYLENKSAKRESLSKTQMLNIYHEIFISDKEMHNLVQNHPLIPSTRKTINDSQPNETIHFSSEVDEKEESEVSNVITQHTQKIIKSLSSKDFVFNVRFGSVQELPSQFEHKSVLRQIRCATMDGLETVKEEEELRDILIVDDDAFNILTLEMMLGSLGKKCDTAFNGKEAIEKLKKRKELIHLENGDFYKIVFMDYNMPIMNGIETAQQIQEMIHKHLIPDVPIIGCTAHTDVKDECILSGMKDCITKPINKDEIIKLLEKYEINYNLTSLRRECL